MARPIICDFCHEREAAFMYTVFTDGSSVAGCEDDAPQFAFGLAVSLGIIAEPVMLGTGEPEAGNGLPLPQDVIDEIEAHELGEPVPDPVTDEPTDEPVDQAAAEAPRRRRKASA